MRPSAPTRRPSTISSASSGSRSRRSASVVAVEEAVADARTRLRRTPPSRPGGRSRAAAFRPAGGRGRARARSCPAPVSPVMTLRPGSSRSSARSIRRRFSTRSSRSMPQVYQRGPTEPDAERAFVSRACYSRAPRIVTPRAPPSVRQPAELLPEAVVEGRARDLGQQRPRRPRSATSIRPPGAQLAHGAAVGDDGHLVAVRRCSPRSACRPAPPPAPGPSGCAAR